MLDLKNERLDFRKYNNRNFNLRDKVSLSSLQITFKNFKSWAALNNEDSELV